MPLPLTPFYYIRHGESESNRDRIMAGSGIDKPLTEAGRAQARAAGEVLAKLSHLPSVICYSPMLRAMETAQLINTHLNLPMIEAPDLVEHGVGEWEGMTWDEVASFWEHGMNPPGGETYPEFHRRVKKGMQTALQNPGPVLVVAHGGVWQAIKSLYAPADYFEIDNAIPHHFEPLPEHALYPWRIHRLSLCTVSGGLLRDEQRFDLLASN